MYCNTACGLSPYFAIFQSYDDGVLKLYVVCLLVAGQISKALLSSMHRNRIRCVHIQRDIMHQRDIRHLRV